MLPIRCECTNVRAIAIGQPYAWAIVKKGNQIEKMCTLVEVVTESDA